MEYMFLAKLPTWLLHLVAKFKLHIAEGLFPLGGLWSHILPQEQLSSFLYICSIKLCAHSHLKALHVKGLAKCRAMSITSQPVNHHRVDTPNTMHRPTTEHLTSASPSWPQNGQSLATMHSLTQNWMPNFFKIHPVFWQFFAKMVYLVSSHRCKYGWDSTVVTALMVDFCLVKGLFMNI